MKQLKLKKQVVKIIYMMAVAAIFISVLLVGGLIKSNLIIKDDYSYVMNPIFDSAIPVIDIKNEKIIKPYVGENVKVEKGFYSKDAEEKDQQNSIIYYQNTYMQNSGILYTSNESFDIVSVLDGKVSNIKEDNILGNVVEISHNDKLLTIYYSVKDINVNVGDELEQGDLIGISGTNNLNSKYQNSLLFEVYSDSHLINPETFFSMDVKSLQN